MKKYILLSGLLVTGTMAFAQAEFDALKYSLTDISGTARYVSMSGAFGALGGDMSTLGMNPAGIAVFRSSELSITPSMSSTSSQSIFNGYESGGNKLNLLIDNFGYVGSFRTYDESEISNFNFGIAYNKVKDFNRDFSVKGENRTSSLLDRIVADQNDKGGTEAALKNLASYAYEAYLINTNATTNKYESLLGVGDLVNNSMYMMESGGVNEWNLSLGANYGHVVYVGMSLGIQSINYELNSNYKEDSEGTAQNDPIGFELKNVLTTQGSGVNVKLGVIVRPVPDLRLGFAFHSSTYYLMTDVFNASISSYGMELDGEPLTPYYKEPEDGSADYQFKTPSRLLYSVAYQVGQKGFLSLDWDVVDYREINLKDADGFPYDDTNSYIYQDFRVASNLRLGGEYRLSDNISLRGGAAWYQSPVKATVEQNNFMIVTAGTTPQYGIEKDTYYLSCGLGYRTGGFFMDAALQRQFHNENFYNFYDDTANADPKYADLKTTKTNLVLTAGFKF